MTPALIIGAAALAGTGGIVLGGGRGVAQAKNTTLKFYDRNFKATVDKWWGEDPVNIKFKRLAPGELESDIKNDVNEGDMTFRLTDFSFYHAERAKRVEEFLKRREKSKKKVTVEELNQVRKELIGNVVLEEEIGGTTGVDTSAGEQLLGVPLDIEYFDIEIIVHNKDLTVGELDFANWKDNPNFTIAIIDKQEGRELDKSIDSEKHNKVAEYLKRYTKTTSAELMPDELAQKAIRQARGDGLTGLFGLIDLAQSKLANLPLIGKYLGDKTVRMVTDPMGGVDPHIKDASYIGALIQVASKISAEEEDNSILENYFKVRKQQVKNELYRVQLQEVSLKEELETRKAVKETWTKRIMSRFYTTLKIIGIILLVVVTIALIASGVGIAVYGASAFFVAVLGTAGTIASLTATAWTIAKSWILTPVQQTLSAAATKLLPAFIAAAPQILIVGIPIFALGAALFTKGIPDYKDECIKLVKEDLKQSRLIKAKVLEDLEKVEREELGALATLDAIREMENKTLDLSDEALFKLIENKARLENIDTEDLREKLEAEAAINLGGMGFAVLCNNVISSDLGFNCEKLILENSGVTGEQLATLFNLLGKAQKTEGQAKIREINIKRNRIGSPSLVMETLYETLKKNCTLTKFEYDRDEIDGEVFSEKIITGIQQQLAINRYLQGAPLLLGEKEIGALFPGEGAPLEKLEHASRLKAKEDFSIVESPAPEKPSPETPSAYDYMEKTIEQNKLLAKIHDIKTNSNDMEDTSAKKILDTIRTLPDRGISFLKTYTKVKIDNERMGVHVSVNKKPRILATILQHPEELVKDLSPEENLNHEQCERLFKALSPEIKDANKKTFIVGALLENLPFEQRTGNAPKVIGALIKLAMEDNDTIANFREKLSNKRKEIINNDDLTIQEKRNILHAIDTACFASKNIERSETDFMAYRLEESLKTHSPNLKTALEEVVYLFKNITKGNFISIYNHIDIPQREKLLLLVSSDMNKNIPRFGVLKTLKATKRAELIEAARIISHRSVKAFDERMELDREAHGIAVIASMLLDIPESMTDGPIDSKYITQALTKNLTLRKYIHDLTDLRDSSTSPARKTAIDKVIQAGIQADILNRMSFHILSEQTHTWLSTLLKNNYELIDLAGFDFVNWRKQMGDEEVPFPENAQEYIKYICNRNKLIKEIKALEDTSANEALISTKQQKLLEMEILYHLSDPKIDPEWDLKNKLYKNYNLMEFDFGGTEVSLKARDYINLICKRNKLKKAVEGGIADLSNIIALYKQVPMDKCREVLSHINKDRLLALLQEDLLEEGNIALPGKFFGSDRLKNLLSSGEKVGFRQLANPNLNKPHRIALLEHIFYLPCKVKIDMGMLREAEIDYVYEETKLSALKKAALISGLIELLPALEEQNDDDCKYIMSYMMYWALSSKLKKHGQTPAPYYRLKDMLEGSEGALGSGVGATLNKPLKSVIDGMIEETEKASELKTNLQNLYKIVGKINDANLQRTAKLNLISNVPIMLEPTVPIKAAVVPEEKPVELDELNM